MNQWNIFEWNCYGNAFDYKFNLSSFNWIDVYVLTLVFCEPKNIQTLDPTFRMLGFNAGFRQNPWVICIIYLNQKNSKK